MQDLWYILGIIVVLFEILIDIELILLKLVVVSEEKILRLTDFNDSQFIKAAFEIDDVTCEWNCRREMQL